MSDEKEPKKELLLCPYCGEPLVPMLGSWGCPLSQDECDQRARERKR
jgi:hypothetical protein